MQIILSDQIWQVSKSPDDTKFIVFFRCKPFSIILNKMKSYYVRNCKLYGRSMFNNIRYFDKLHRQGRYKSQKFNVDKYFYFYLNKRMHQICFSTKDMRVN